MEQTGRWIVPQYNGFPYLDKPAFYFRLVALSLGAFGRTEWAARLPSALFGLATLALVAAFCLRVYGRRVAALSVAIAATAPLILVFARLVIFDMVLAFFVCAAIFAGYLAEEREGRARRGWHVAGALAAGLATLVKGPIGFLLPGLVLVAFHLVERRPRAIARLLSPWNLLVFLGVVLPWFLAVARQRPDFPRYGLLDESLHRFTSPRFDRAKPFWFYLPVVLGGLGVWAAVVPRAAVRALRERARLTRPDRLFLVWVLATLLLFSLSSSKMPQYVLTTAIALAVLVARVFAAALEAPDGRAAAGVRRAVVASGIVCAVGAAGLLAFVLERAPLVRLLGIESGSFDRAEPIMAPAAAALGLMAVAAFAALRLRGTRALVGFPVAAHLLLLGVTFAGIVEYAEAASGRPLVRRIEEVAPGAPLVCLGCYPRGVAFYAGRYPTVVTRDGRELASNYLRYTLEHGGAWPESIVPEKSLDTWLASIREPVLLLANRGTRPALAAAAEARGSELVDLVPGWWGAVVRPRASD
jgi:4-amino-4-deoxy-L-arabinose transferase-like glycosyltransferase